jgi:hypothetical protein
MQKIVFDAGMQTRPAAPAFRPSEAHCSGRLALGSLHLHAVMFDNEPLRLAVIEDAISRLKRYPLASLRRSVLAAFGDLNAVEDDEDVRAVAFHADGRPCHLIPLASLSSSAPTFKVSAIPLGAVLLPGSRREGDAQDEIILRHLIARADDGSALHIDDAPVGHAVTLADVDRDKAGLAPWRGHRQIGRDLDRHGGRYGASILTQTSCLYPSARRPFPSMALRS